MMSDADTTVKTGWIHPSMRHLGRIERDLLVGLPQRGGRGVLSGIEAAARES